jgi:hypothetical protein
MRLRLRSRIAPTFPPQVLAIQVFDYALFDSGNSLGLRLPLRSRQGSGRALFCHASFQVFGLRFPVPGPNWNECLSRSLASSNRRIVTHFLTSHRSSPTQLNMGALLPTTRILQAATERLDDVRDSSGERALMNPITAAAAGPTPPVAILLRRRPA